MRRLSIALVLALLTAPVLGMAASPAAHAQTRAPNSSMSNVLPDEPDGWQMSEIRPAKGALPMYSAATAEASYKRGPVEVVVGAARSPTLFKAVSGSIKVPATLPPNGTVEVVNGYRAIITRFPEAKVPLYQIQIPVGADGIIMLTTRTGTVDHLLELAQELNFSPFPLR
ncbi:hypothetical protein [Niveispirillum fermenti]|uniref:hypothetical protein n=1 Tax=Niveispirillum fermenti TaxID=1233113 RepID=UPI003A83519A